MKLWKRLIMSNEKESVKLIATDMDGTFLDDNKKFDVTLFQEVMDKLNKENIKFVIASGNQYQHLVDIFDDTSNKFSYIADNGAVIVDKGKIISQKFINMMEIHQALDLLKNDSELKDGLIVLSGQKSAYIEKGVPSEFVDEGSKYYRKITMIDSLYDVKDKIYKIALAWPNQSVRKQEAILKDNLSNLHITSSGYGGVDIIPEGVNKGKAISILQNYMHLKESQLMAFGDSDNDLELLKHCHHSYAMKNANEIIKKTARYHTNWDNNDSGVLRTIQLVVK
jgi:HAD-superfamily hydrolase, subfamily IIB